MNRGQDAPHAAAGGSFKCVDSSLTARNALVEIVITSSVNQEHDALAAASSHGDKIIKVSVKAVPTVKL